MRGSADYNKILDRMEQNILLDLYGGHRPGKLETSKKMAGGRKSPKKISAGKKSPKKISGGRRHKICAKEGKKRCHSVMAQRGEKNRDGCTRDTSSGVCREDRGGDYGCKEGKTRRMDKKGKERCLKKLT